MSHLLRPPALALCCSVLLASACDPGDPAQESGESGSETPCVTTGPMVVDCSFHWEGATTTLRYEDEHAAELSFGDLRVSPSLFDDEYEGRSFSITAYTEDGTVGNTVIYQMLNDQHPRNEFVGQHGFTGLNWVRDPASMDNLQYACFARSPDDPVQGFDD